METVAITDVVSTVIHYFRHTNKEVQVAAFNAGQFLVPYIKSFSTRRLFILSDESVQILIHSFGKLMPASSSLKLLHSFSSLQDNCVTFVKKGIPLLATSVMVISPRPIEKELAFQLLKNLLQVPPCDRTTSVKPSSESSMFTTPTECVVEDIVSELKMKLKRVLSDNLPSIQEQYTCFEILLKHLKRAKLSCQRDVEELSTLIVQCVNKITKGELGIHVAILD